MVKEHLDQTRQNQRSTKKLRQSNPPPTPVIPTVPDDDDPFPSNLTDGHRTHVCYAATLEPTNQVYTNQTGRFVTPSSPGNNYLMVLYDYDSNAILTTPLRNRKAQTILDGYKILHARLCQAGLRPKLQRLDNKCSTILKEFMTDESIDFQLVPPGIHQRNAAERAI
jgi:hypothetical protein